MTISRRGDIIMWIVASVVYVGRSYQQVPRKTFKKQRLCRGKRERESGARDCLSGARRGKAIIRASVLATEVTVQGVEQRQRKRYIPTYTICIYMYIVRGCRRARDAQKTYKYTKDYARFIDIYTYV